MPFKPDPSCTYTPGEGTCVRDCQISCMRNYRDQLDCDLPLQTSSKQVTERKSWWQRHFGHNAGHNDR